jgi:hypothetical protein
VEKPSPISQNQPIGVLKSLAVGFEKIAAQPLLVIPSLLLDLFLWLGPHLTIPEVFSRLADTMTIPVGAEAFLVEQVQLLREGVLELGNRINLVSLVASLPVGLPSLMSGVHPVATPLGEGLLVPIASPVSILFTILLIGIVGQAIGAQFHLWVAQTMAPREELANRWGAMLKMVLLAAFAFGMMFLIVMGFSVFAVLMALLLPLFGFIVAFLGFSFIFWAFIYLIFTPHGIIRYRLGIVRAMIESATLVRWNLIPVVGYLILAYGVSWLTNQVWFLPGESTWYTILAIVGHAFVSVTLLAGSYAFYQDRRQWMFAVREAKPNSEVDLSS